MEAIKKVAGISLGSSKRDHTVELNVLGTHIQAYRKGCDGDLDLMRERLIEADQDPDVAAIGLGGVSITLEAAGKSYVFREIKDLVKVVKNTPIVDGTGLKDAVEGRAASYLRDELGVEVKGKKALITSAVDRWGLAMAFDDAGAINTYGDLLYALDLNVMVNSRKTLTRVIKLVMPVARLLPFTFLYPTTTDSETKTKRTAFTDKLYAEADFIVGDFKYVVKYLPPSLEGKIVITNTTTPEDIELLKNHGVDMIVTTTPNLEGRTFGTNVIEAMLVASQGADKALTYERYYELMVEAGFRPAAYDFRDKT